MSGDDAPLSETLFQMGHNLCTIYSISPFDIDGRRFSEVVELYADVRRMQIREEKNTIQIEKGGRTQKVIRVPAPDTWF